MQIGDLASAAFNVLATETSTIVVNFVPDGQQVTNDRATTGAFYITHTLYENDCSTVLPGSVPYALGTLTVDDGVGTSTTTIVNDGTDNWVGTVNQFCLGLALYLKMDGSTETSTDTLYHKKDFHFTVTVTNDSGSKAFVVDTIDASIVAMAASSATAAPVQEAGAAPSIAAPTIGAGAPFTFGETISLTLAYTHPTNSFTYNVDTATIIPIDPLSDVQFVDGSLNPIDFSLRTYVGSGTYPTLGGQIDVKVPLQIYQKSPASIKVQYTVAYTSVRRRLGEVGDVHQQQESVEVTLGALTREILEANGVTVEEMIAAGIDPSLYAEDEVDGSGAITMMHGAGAAAFAIAGALII
jgi:hypothetical protein